LAARQNLTETAQALAKIGPELVTAIAQAIARVQQRGGTVYIFGNGGSASTAEHFVCDLAKAARTAHRRLSVVAPSANTARVTATANDSSYAEVFAEQLEGALSGLDLAIAISASGNSPNVLRAVQVARDQGAFTVGLVGFGGGALSSLVDLALVVDSPDYGVIENAHLAVEHAVTAAFAADLRTRC
jgi:D-sedoheptulose 7-phosphate isomerase